LRAFFFVRQPGDPGSKRLTTMKARKFDKKFDDGEDVSDFLDWDNAKRPNLEIKRVNIDFPAWVIEGLDQQARLLGVTRQSLIKFWVAERLRQV
jgi:hypothetical protein